MQVAGGIAGGLKSLPYEELPLQGGGMTPPQILPVRVVRSIPSVARGDSSPFSKGELWCALLQKPWRRREYDNAFLMKTRPQASV